MKHLLALIAAGLVGAFAFTFGAIFPLYVMLPLVLVACALIIGTAILRDVLDAARARAIVEAAREAELA